MNCFVSFESRCAHVQVVARANVFSENESAGW